MHYVRHQQRDSIPLAAPLLLALGSLGLFAIVWRRTTAPRLAQPRARRVPAASPSAPGRPQFVPRAPASPEAVAAGSHQTAESGTGALVHRQYEITLELHQLLPADMLRLMQRHITELAPSALANFEKTAGSETIFRVGDEYDITMLGPWNGRVRVAELTPDSFTLVTLDGHPESGHITFSSRHSDALDGSVTVMIESWARSRDAVVHAAYSTLRIGKQVQAEVWITFLQRLSALAGATETPQVRITTEEIPSAAPTTEPAARDA